MARHTGTCQHVIHPLDAKRRERKNSTGPIRSGGNRAPGFIELDDTKATPQQNAKVRPCLNCSVPKRGRMTLDEAKHWPTKGRSQMTIAFDRAFAVYAERRGEGYSATRGRRVWGFKAAGASARQAA